jgi:predicted metal-dependent peptidase
MSHSARARRALAQLQEVDPALGVLALWCTHRDTDAPTFTEGETIYYGPGFESLPAHEQVGVAAHHVLHVALRHSARSEALAQRLGERFDAGLYALAADAIVNETLIAADLPVPRPAVTLGALLKDIGAPSASALTALADWDADRLALRLHRDGATRAAAAEHGAARAFAPDLAPHQGGGGPDEDKAADWQGHLVRAMEAGRSAGAGIGMLGRVIADITPAQIPWERHLRGLLAKAVAEAPQITYRRPAGRWVAMAAHAQETGAPDPVFEPGRQRTAWRPRIVVAIDSSSSIEPLTLRLFAAEADGIARRTGAEIIVLSFDTVIQSEHVVRAGLLSALRDGSLKGGGGTDFDPVLERLRALAPSAAVILTDLEAVVGRAPGCPVIWVAPSGAPMPPWGHVLTLDT